MKSKLQSIIMFVRENQSGNKFAEVCSKKKGTYDRDGYIASHFLLPVPQYVIQNRLGSSSNFFLAYPQSVCCSTKCIILKTYFKK